VPKDCCARTTKPETVWVRVLLATVVVTIVVEMKVLVDVAVASMVRKFVVCPVTVRYVYAISVSVDRAVVLMVVVVSVLKKFVVVVRVEKLVEVRVVLDEVLVTVLITRNGTEKYATPKSLFTPPI
jgi:hypothetical protein